MVMSLTLIFAIPQEPFKKDGKKEEGLKHNMMAKKVTTVVKDVKLNNMELNLTHNKTPMFEIYICSQVLENSLLDH